MGCYLPIEEKKCFDEPNKGYYKIRGGYFDLDILRQCSCNKPLADEDPSKTHPPHLTTEEFRPSIGGDNTSHFDDLNKHYTYVYYKMTTRNNLEILDRQTSSIPFIPFHQRGQLWRNSFGISDWRPSPSTDKWISTTSLLCLLNLEKSHFVNYVQS